MELIGSTWTHLIRFIAVEDGETYYGQVNSTRYPDVGSEAFEGNNIAVNVVSGSPFNGVVTDRILHVSKVQFFNHRRF